MLALVFGFVVAMLQVLAVIATRRPVFHYWAGDRIRCVEAKATHAKLQRVGAGNSIRLQNADQLERVAIVATAREVFRLPATIADGEALHLVEVFLHAVEHPVAGVAINKEVAAPELCKV
jgi:hypothetical protein